MFFSPSPITKRLPSSTDQLNRYLPQMDHSQFHKQQALYSKFSTVQQIAKSIDIEKERFDEQNMFFNSRLNQSTNLLSKKKKNISDLKHKVQNIQFGDSFQQARSSSLQELPSIPLDTIFYTLNQKPKSSSSLKKDEIHILFSEIQKLEKDCAQLYCNQNQKFQSFEQHLFIEFDKMHDKLVRSNNQKSNYAFLQLKIMQDHEKLQAKIRQWESQLNQQFQDKILKLIQKAQKQNQTQN